MMLDLWYFVWIAPGVILALLAQWWISAAYARGQAQPASMSGFSAAQKILDAAGIYDVRIESVPGHLSDHYDPREKVLRLSNDVYHGRNLAAVGIAAHECGHAIQDAVGYAPLVVRNWAVPAANFGSSMSGILLIGGFIFSFKPLILAGIVLFGAFVLFQLVNLPVEFNASSRAKTLLVDYGIVSEQEMGPVRSILWAAALTYVAATLQAVLTLLYYVTRMRDR